VCVNLSIIKVQLARVTTSQAYGEVSPIWATCLKHLWHNLPFAKEIEEQVST